MKSIKPFYIYTDNNSLYIKNINSQTEKLSNNIYAYCANIDNANNIHICGVDIKGKLNYFYKNNNLWKKRAILKIFNNVKNVKDMRLYIINNFLNIFIVEKYPLSDNLYKVSHFNFNPSNYKVSRYTINNIYKTNEYFYKLHIDDLSNIIFEYNISSSNVKDKNTLIFNNNSRKWLNTNEILNDSNRSENDKNIKSTIREEIFEYCYSITYKI